MTGDSFVIEGFGDKRRLEGEIMVSGAKNAILPAMAGALLFRGPVRYENVPGIEDVKRVGELLTKLGAVLDWSAPHSLSINAASLSSGLLDSEISKQLRASIVLIGPLLAQVGRVSFPHPGGCVIGERPIDIFLRGFEKMGASVLFSDGIYTLHASRGLRGAEIFFSLPSVTNTETFLMTAVLAKGTTVLRNSALEPEITALANFLSSHGAKISGIGTTTLTIEGGELLEASDLVYRTIPDRIEAGSFLILGAIAGEKLKVTGCDPSHLEALIDILSRVGARLKIGKDFIEVRGSGGLLPVHLKTHEYPGFPTDLQAPMTVMLTQAKGESSVFETIFDGRFNYVEDLVRMGANISLWHSNKISIKGQTPLKARHLVGPDLRAGLAFVIAAIIAKGESRIDNVYYIDRGYERIEERLRATGANIQRVIS